MKISILTLIFVLLSVACNQATAPVVDDESWLVTLKADTATVDVTANTITLYKPATPTVFSDEPYHDVLTFPANTQVDGQNVTPITFLAKIWDPANRKSPPNAVFTSGDSSMIVEIQGTPTLTGDNFVLNVKFLSGKPTATKTYTSPTITVDNWRSCMSMIPRCTFAGGVSVAVVNPLTFPFLVGAKLLDQIADLGVLQAAGLVPAKQIGLCLADTCDCFQSPGAACDNKY